MFLASEIFQPLMLASPQKNVSLDRRRRRKRRAKGSHLRSKRRIEILREEVVIEVFDIQCGLGEDSKEGLARAKLDGLLDDPVSIIRGGLSLRLGQETTELIGVHVGGALGVGGEGGADVGGRLDLGGAEAAGEAEAAGVGPHWASDT